MKGFAAVVGLMGLVVLAGCGGSGSSNPSNTNAVAGNWQFTLQKTASPRTTTMLSGFLQQTGKAVAGAVELTPPLAGAPPCGGSFQATGTNDGQNVTLTINEGGATISLTGTASSSAMGGLYSLVANGCGKDESGTWTATLVKPLNGTFQGVLHSTDTNTVAKPLLKGSDFVVTGQIFQGDNIGATRATLTGTISVPNADYPCFTDATLSGNITGSQVLLNIIATNGNVIGTIGSVTAATAAVTAKPDGSGFLNLGSIGYAINKSPGCDSQEVGKVCVDIGTSTSCKQPVAFSQVIVGFNPTLVTTSSSSQTVTLTNQSSSALPLGSLGIPTGVNPSDFVVDASGCTDPLPAQSSCPIVVTFTPTASCLPFDGTFSTPLKCPLPRTAALSLSTSSSDPDSPHLVQLTGMGMNAAVPNANDLNFGVIPVGTISPPLTVTFTNQGPVPVTIMNFVTGGLDTGLGAYVPCGTVGSQFPACDFVTKSQVSTANNCTPPSTLQDSCTGQAILPNGSCKVDVVFCPLNPGPITEDIQITTDEHDANGPTADSTRVPVQLDGTAN